jgi:hypothetical protein
MTMCDGSVTRTGLSERLLESDESDVIPCQAHDSFWGGIDVDHLPNAHWQGQDTAYQDRLRDLFQKEIPKTTDEHGKLVIDWPKATEMLRH